MGVHLSIAVVMGTVDGRGKGGGRQRGPVVSETQALCRHDNHAFVPLTHAWALLPGMVSSSITPITLMKHSHSRGSMRCGRDAWASTPHQCLIPVWPGQ